MTKTRRLVAALLALVGLMALAATPAVAFRGHSFGSDYGWGVSDGKSEAQVCTLACRAGAAGAGNGQFSEPSDVAVNEATGDVYVLDQGNARVEVFGHDHKYVSQFGGGETPAKAFSFGTVPLTGGIAVDNSCYFKKLSGAACTNADPSNGDVYVTDPGNEVVDKFSAAGAYLGQLEENCGKASCPAFEFKAIAQIHPTGVAVDANGTVWGYVAQVHVSGDVYSFTNGVPNVLNSAQVLNGNGPVDTGFSCPGFAVDGEDSFYARRAHYGQCTVTSEVFKFDASGEVLLAPFVEEESSAVAVDLSSNEVFLDNVTSIGAFSSEAAEQERFGGQGEIAGGAGLGVDRENGTDSTVYVVDAAANRVDVFVPEPPSPPRVMGESVSSVTGNSAALQAEIAPHGASTSFHFEYGRCATVSTCVGSPFEASVPVPDGVAGSDFEVHTVSAYPQDLVAGAVYHSRVVASNELNKPEEVIVGSDQVFTTQPAGVFELPDGRAWELVSPPDKHGAVLEPIKENGVVQASVAGDAITYLADAPIESEPQGNALHPQALSTRGADGWVSRDIAPPHETATGQTVGKGQEYRVFSSDLSRGVVQRFGAFTPSLSPHASEQTPLLRTLFASGAPSQPCLPASMDCFRPLVSGCPEAGEECPLAVEEDANVPAGTKFGEEGKCPPTTECGPVFEGATSDLHHIVLESKLPLLGTPAVKEGLYEWSEGQLALVSVLPKSEGGAAVSAVFGDLSRTDSRGAISSDGSRVVWMSNLLVQNHLYLYDSAKGGSIRLDPGLSGTPEFQSATANVSEVFFTESGDLYRYDVEAEKLERLTTGAQILGSLPAISQDGSYVYFVANGVLAGGAVAGKCQDEFTAGNECNLYVLHEGTISLVGVLSSEDFPDWRHSLVGLTARVSPDGRWFAFMSNRSLTGYDNRDAVSGQRDEEVFLYDAQQQRLVCASCNPTGARPAGVEYESRGTGLNLVGGDRVWNGQQWLAANIPGWTPYQLGQALYQSRYLSNSGRLFFNSNEALAPQDVNGTWDVYEYEPPGVPAGPHACTTASASYSERSGGCVAPVSSGRSPEESGFLDASETGGDVFFLTTAKLASQDSDTALDIYDAHECTGASPCLPPAPAQPAECTTEASCRAAPSPQPSIFGAPASATFSGTGNVAPVGIRTGVKPKTLTRAQKLARALKACRRRPKRKRGACEKRARRAYGPVGKKATKSNRRAG